MTARTTGRILVIEDDADVAVLLRALLEGEGHEVVEAADGLLGLAKLQIGGADAVLLDVMMPDLDGERVLAQLLEEHDGQLPLPVIVVTGSPEAAGRCRQLLGPDDVFEKPFDPTRLLARLRHRLAAS